MFKKINNAHCCAIGRALRFRSGNGRVHTKNIYRRHTDTTLFWKQQHHVERTRTSALSLGPQLQMHPVQPKSQ